MTTYLGNTYLLDTITCQAVGTIQQITVENAAAFPVNSFLMVTNGGNAVMTGAVTSTDGASAISFEVATSTVGGVMLAGSAVTFSGPQGPAGSQGPTGLPGHGSTYTLSPTLVYPVGTKIQITVPDAQAFPPYTYILVSDGTYGVVGQVVSSTFNGNSSTIVLKIVSIIGGVAGASILAGAIVTFSGPPGPRGATQAGDFGTVLYRDIVINPPATFYSGDGINQTTVLASLNLRLPNTQQVNYRVVFEFDGNIITNQALSQSQYAYIGVASNASIQATNESAVYAGIGETITTAPVIQYSNVIADERCIVGATGNPGSNAHLKYVGTFGPNTQIDFALVAAAEQQFSSFFAAGVMSAACYPIYG